MRIHEATIAGSPPPNSKCSTFSVAGCVSLQSSWSSLRRTAGSQADGRTCPLTPGTSTLSSCSWLPSSTTSSGSSPSTRWARVSPAAPPHDTRPVELVRSTTHTHLKCVCLNTDIDFSIFLLNVVYLPSDQAQYFMHFTWQIILSTKGFSSYHL